jgi:hypothetical protein
VVVRQTRPRSDSSLRFPDVPDLGRSLSARWKLVDRPTEIVSVLRQARRLLERFRAHRLGPK